MFFIFFPALIAFNLSAQRPSVSDGRNVDVFSEIESAGRGGGVINIDQSARMKDLVLTHINMNKQANGIEGFRVQLYSGGGNKARQEAIDVKEEVLSQFPEMDVSVEYSAPFWRVRVGVFRHKHEALPLIDKLRKSFPACYVVKVNEIPLNALK